MNNLQTLGIGNYCKHLFRTITPEPYDSSDFIRNNFSMTQPHFKFCDNWKCNSIMNKYKEEIKQNEKIDLINLENRKKKTVQKETEMIYETTKKLDIKAIESWINTILKDVIPSSIPKSHLNKEGKTPLSKFGIDRGRLKVYF